VQVAQDSEDDFDGVLRNVLQEHNAAIMFVKPEYRTGIDSEAFS